MPWSLSLAQSAVLVLAANGVSRLMLDWLTPIAAAQMGPSIAICDMARLDAMLGVARVSLSSGPRFANYSERYSAISSDRALCD